jgi:hypothetical protein
MACQARAEHVATEAMLLCVIPWRFQVTREHCEVAHGAALQPCQEGERRTWSWLRARLRAWRRAAHAAGRAAPQQARWLTAVLVAGPAVSSRGRPKTSGTPCHQLLTPCHGMPRGGSCTVYWASCWAGCTADAEGHSADVVLWRLFDTCCAHAYMQHLSATVHGCSSAAAALTCGPSGKASCGSSGWGGPRWGACPQGLRGPPRPAAGPLLLPPRLSRTAWGWAQWSGRRGPWWVWPGLTRTESLGAGGSGEGVLVWVVGVEYEA